MTSRFPSQMVNKTESVSMSWCHQNGNLTRIFMLHAVWFNTNIVRKSTYAVEFHWRPVVSITLLSIAYLLYLCIPIVLSWYKLVCNPPITCNYSHAIKILKFHFTEWPANNDWYRHGVFNSRGTTITSEDACARFQLISYVTYIVNITYFQ